MTNPISADLTENYKLTLAEAIDECCRLEKERDDAQQACAVAYQILGSLSEDIGIFDHPLIQKALTMLADHEETEPLLPWPSKTLEEWRKEAAVAAVDAQEHSAGVVPYD